MWVLEGSLESPSRQLLLVEGDAEVVVLAPEHR